ncbi:MAG: EamA family transporter, partial [Sphingomonadales bacterium]
NSTLFGNSATLIFPIYGFIAARMWPTRLQGLALLLAAIGAGLLLGRSASLSADNLTGDLLCLFAGVLYAVYFVFMARARERLAPIPALAMSSIATIPPLLILALAMGETVMPGNWWPVVILAVVSQLIGQGCMIFALGHLSPLVIGIGLLIQPVFAAGLGWFVYDERLAAADVAGAILVAMALVLVRSSEVASPPKEPKSA